MKTDCKKLLKKTLASCFMTVYNSQDDVAIARHVWTSVLNDDWEDQFKSKEDCFIAYAKIFGLKAHYFKPTDTMYLFKP